MNLNWKQDGDTLKAERHGFEYTIRPPTKMLNVAGFVSWSGKKVLTIHFGNSVKETKEMFQSHADTIEATILNDPVRKMLARVVYDFLHFPGDVKDYRENMSKALAAYDKEQV